MAKDMLKVSALEKHPEYPKALGLLSAEIGVLEMLLGELLGAVLGITRELGQVIYNSPQSFYGASGHSFQRDCTGAQSKSARDKTTK